MKDFKKYISEASKPEALEAERLRKNGIAALKKAIKKPGLVNQTVKNLKEILQRLIIADYLIMQGNTKSDWKKILDDLKGVNGMIKRELYNDALYRKMDAEEKKILANPYTICDLLANPKPSKFVDLIKGDVPDASAKWIDELEKVKEAFFDWFEAQGGRKARMIKVFHELMSCKNRAPWASWSGKAYRGVMRSTKIVSKYDFTGETKKIGNIEWLIAKGTYKSRYDAQSWSDEWRTAEEFATSNMSGLENPIGVIFEVNLKRTDTLLSPDVVKQISIYGKGVKKEREVIRVGNAPLPVAVYVNADSIVDGIVTNSSSKQFGKRSREYVYNRAATMIGVKGADAFAKTKEFKKLVKDFE
jgi:hypothetical protein